MQRFFEAAFRPSRPSAPDGKNYAILPQQTQDELIVSSVHSKLDRVLQFLQQDVGYVLLDDARPNRGGGVQLGEPTAPFVERAAGPRGHRSTRIPKGEPLVDEEEAKQVIRFSTETAKYAQYPDDLVLVWRFTNILATANPAHETMVKQELLYKTVLQGIRLMHLCSYDYSDLVLTLAYASVYFRTTCEAIGHTMSQVEAAHVVVLLIFLAHCFVIDETCPLRYWQKYIFKKYCTLKVLDAALFQVFQMHDFKLRISEEDEKHALSVLLCAESGRDVILSLNEGADARLRASRMGTSSSSSTGSGTAGGTSGSSCTGPDGRGANIQAAGSPAAGGDGAQNTAIRNGDPPSAASSGGGEHERSLGMSNGHQPSRGPSGGGQKEQNPSMANGHHSVGGGVGGREVGVSEGRDARGRGGDDVRPAVLELDVHKSIREYDDHHIAARSGSGSSSASTTANSSRDQTPAVSSVRSDFSQVADWRAAPSAETMVLAGSKHVHVP